jgi:hypothetical protein
MSTFVAHRWARAFLCRQFFRSRLEKRRPFRHPVVDARGRRIRPLLMRLETRESPTSLSVYGNALLNYTPPNLLSAARNDCVQSRIGCAMGKSTKPVLGKIRAAGPG